MQAAWNDWRNAFGLVCYLKIGVKIRVECIIQLLRSVVMCGSETLSSKEGTEKQVGCIRDENVEVDVMYNRERHGME